MQIRWKQNNAVVKEICSWLQPFCIQNLLFIQPRLSELSWAEYSMTKKQGVDSVNKELVAMTTSFEGSDRLSTAKVLPSLQIS